MKIMGSRTLKTAVAVFLTAVICETIGWSPVFAVITAIVTLEPTVTDSIKKGLVRFPASAIGSFYAVLFIALFGHSPLAYTLAATLTILSCYHLKLHAGLLVATITSVAMIEVVHDHYIQSFFIRLGTTSIGLTVATLVNLVILPRNYTKEIRQHLHEIDHQLGAILEHLFDVTEHEGEEKLKELQKKYEEAETLVQLLLADTRYELPFVKKKQNMIKLQETMQQLRFVLYHITNLQRFTLQETSLTASEKHLLREAMVALAQYIKEHQTTFPTTYERKLEELMRSRMQQSSIATEDTAKLSNEFVLLNEIITLYRVIQQMDYIRQKNNKNAQ